MSGCLVQNQESQTQTVLVKKLKDNFQEIFKFIEKRKYTSKSDFLKF